MIQLAGFVVVAFGLFLIAFTGVTFARPALAERFLSGFASSARTHYLEEVVRLVVGAALIVLSPVMWQPKLFSLIGWAVVVSSTALMCTPWRWHQRFAQRVLPTVLRHLKLSAVGPLVFGALLLYAVFARQTA
jgi:hypothetical protein